MKTFFYKIRKASKNRRSVSENAETYSRNKKHFYDFVHVSKMHRNVSRDGVNVSRNANLHPDKPENVFSNTEQLLQLQKCSQEIQKHFVNRRFILIVVEMFL